jgi:hypothetical protein
VSTPAIVPGDEQRHPGLDQSGRGLAQQPPRQPGVLPPRLLQVAPGRHHVRDHLARLGLVWDVRTRRKA